MMTASHGSGRRVAVGADEGHELDHQLCLPKLSGDLHRRRCHGYTARNGSSLR